MTVSDLHLHPGLYHQLEAAVDEHKPDVLALLGDFLDARFPPHPGLLHPSSAGWLLSSLPCQVVCVRGNHDDWQMEDFVAGWNPNRSPLVALHEEAAVVCGIPITGFPCWLGDESFYAGIASRRRARHQAGKDGGVFTPIASLSDWERPALTRSLWLMHEPPVRSIASTIAVCEDWRLLVESQQPDVVVCGHDHSTPIKTGVWHVRHGRTRIISTGQALSPQSALRFCMLEFHPNGDFRAATLIEGTRKIQTITAR